MLQSPMEPFDYPDNDPGPQTLLAAATPAQNLQRLHWQMGRFTGYVGIANYMGGRFTSTPQALTPVLREVAARGLIYADDGSSARSLAGPLGRDAGLAAPVADLVIDADPSPTAIDGALARLEAAARKNGTAFGVGTALPVTLAHLKDWTAHLAARGVRLVPVSALAADGPTGSVPPPRQPGSGTITMTTMTDPAALPYRPCAGAMLLNPAGLVLVGRRRGGPEAVATEPQWQMPQGGIDGNEGPEAAARRELYEETNVRQVTLLAEAPDWYAYDLPPEVPRHGWTRRYRGQTQRWFAFCHEGPESEIDVHHPGGGAAKPEFDAWRWVGMDELPGLVVAFKRPVYEAVLLAFRHLV